MADYNENQFEREIAEHLHAHGWLYSDNDEGYDAERALFPEDIFGWLSDTQPNELVKVVKSGSEPEKGQLLDRLAKTLDTPLEAGGGSLTVLRQGFRHIAASFEMAQFKPDSTLNPVTVERYQKMRLRVMRQVHYSTASRHSLDLVLFVNGIPVATLELKTDFTQAIESAVGQYKADRPVKDPVTGREQPLFGFGTRALVHFAVSNDEVWMSTKLAGEKTRFLPFNRGTEDGGKGNPPAAEGKSASSYLWEQVLERDAWLNILGRLLHLETTSTRDPISGKQEKSTTLLFPRFHQWDAVVKLRAAVEDEGPGHRYLIQHSAGSGKTNTIAWTAHRLARLQINNEKVFDSVIVVTDRNVLDAQLQETIQQIDNKSGIVVAVDIDQARKQGEKSKSALLAKALTGGSLIVVVTIQTFPYAMEAIRNNAGLDGKRFAVIADEAHSSQAGGMANKMKAALATNDNSDDRNALDVEELLASAAEDRAASKNVSYFAFTATPKAKTLELFGRRPSPGEKPLPFHIYTMKQAIEEGYILDVLRGYQTYDLAFKVAGEAAADKEVDQAEAARQVKRWVVSHPQTIAQKSGIIVEHFVENVAGLLEGHAKAMVVADSRQSALRYKREIDKYVKSKGYSVGTLVAFSGTLDDPEYGIVDATEASMNPGAGDLRSAFARDDYKVMIVANKFQTGFDQPLLCGMYVDKRLAGVTAVQTLSRLNRTYTTPSGQSKDTTSIVDFVNEPEEIREAFLPYFKDAYLETETDPNLVNDIAAKLDNARIYDSTTVDAVAEAWVKSRGNQALDSALAPAVTSFNTRLQAARDSDDRLQLDELENFRKDLGTFSRVYEFMSQIVNYGSVELEKRLILCRLLERRIGDTVGNEQLDLSSLSLLGVAHTDSGHTHIVLDGDVGLRGMAEAGSGRAKDPKMVAFQEVLDRLNELFGAEDFSDSQPESYVRGLISRMLEDATLVQQAKANSASQFADNPDFGDAVVLAVTDNQGAHNKIADYVLSGAPGRDRLMESLARAFYEEAVDQKVA